MMDRIVEILFALVFMTFSGYSLYYMNRYNRVVTPQKPEQISGMNVISIYYGRYINSAFFILGFLFLLDAWLR